MKLLLDQFIDQVFIVFIHRKFHQKSELAILLCKNIVPSIVDAQLIFRKIFGCITMKWSSIRNEPFLFTFQQKKMVRALWMRNSFLDKCLAVFEINLFHSRFHRHMFEALFLQKVPHQVKTVQIPNLGRERGITSPSPFSIKFHMLTPVKNLFLCEKTLAHL